MARLPLVPPAPPARMKYVVPAVALKLRLALVPPQRRPLLSLQAIGLSEPHKPPYTCSTVSKSLPQVLIRAWPLTVGVKENHTLFVTPEPQPGIGSPAAPAPAVLMV